MNETTEIEPLPIELTAWRIGPQIHGLPSEQHVYRFGNGYGASVVRGPYTYGGDKGKYELAVVRFSGDNFAVTYETPITSDVIGWLDVPEVAKVLDAIVALEPVTA